MLIVCFKILFLWPGLIPSHRTPSIRNAWLEKIIVQPLETMQYRPDHPSAIGLEPIPKIRIGVQGKACNGEQAEHTGSM
jgi:hypothetical protein